MRASWVNRRVEIWYTFIITFHHYFTQRHWICMHIKMNEYCGVYMFIVPFIRLGMFLLRFGRSTVFYFMACINIKYHSMSSNILTSFVFENSTAHYHHFQFISCCCCCCCCLVCYFVSVSLCVCRRIDNNHQRKTQLFVFFDHIILMAILWECWAYVFVCENIAEGWQSRNWKFEGKWWIIKPSTHFPQKKANKHTCITWTTYAINYTHSRTRTPTRSSIADAVLMEKCENINIVEWQKKKERKEKE